MAIKRPKPEEIVMKLRQVEVLMGPGLHLSFLRGRCMQTLDNTMVRIMAS